MKKALFIGAASALCMFGAAFADDEEDMAVYEQQCSLESEAPEMPNPKKATAEDRVETIKKIKEFQAALGVYRDCLTAVSENTELEVEEREAALKEFNRTVKVETDMVEDWQKFDKKYQKANS